MVILHGAIKTIQNGVFPFSSKKEQILFYFLKNKKNRWGCFVLKKKRGFLNPVQT